MCRAIIILVEWMSGVHISISVMTQSKNMEVCESQGFGSGCANKLPNQRFEDKTPPERSTIDDEEPI
jgi:hypothetical protein